MARRLGFGRDARDLLRSVPARLTLLVVVALLLPTATASADVEPANNSLIGAEGPLSGGKVYSGATIDEGAGEDWYYFYAGPFVQLDIRVFTPDECDSSSALVLTDENGQSLASTYLYPNIKIKENHIRYTTPAAGGLFYLRASCGEINEDNEHYSFELQPAASILPGPPPWLAPAPLAEPNEDYKTAAGPLAGDVDYEGATSTINDPDWFYFYTLGQRPLDLRLIPRERCNEAELTLHRISREGEPEQISDAEAETNEVGHILYTTPKGVHAFYLTAECDDSVSLPAGYRFRISPASAVASLACIGAVQTRTNERAKASRLRARLRQAKHNAKRTRNPRARQRIKRKIRKKIKPQLHQAVANTAAADAAVKANC